MPGMTLAAMSYLEEQIHREAQRLVLDLTGLARRAQSAGVFIKATILPTELDWSMHRAMSTAQTRQTGETHITISREHYDL